MTIPLWCKILILILTLAVAYAGWNYIRIFYGKKYYKRMMYHLTIVNLSEKEGHAGVKKFMDENPELVKRYASGGE